MTRQQLHKERDPIHLAMLYIITNMCSQRGPNINYVMFCQNILNISEIKPIYLVFRYCCTNYSRQITYAFKHRFIVLLIKHQGRACLCKFSFIPLLLSLYNH